MPRQKRIIDIRPLGLITRNYHHCRCERLGFPTPLLPPYANPSASCVLKYGQVTQASPITRTALEVQKGGTYLGTALTNPTVYSRFQRFTNVDFGYNANNNISVLGTLPTPTGMYVVVGETGSFTTFNHKIYFYSEVNCTLTFVRTLYNVPTAILVRKTSSSPAVSTIGDFYDPVTNTQVLILSNNSLGAGSIFTNSYTRLEVNSSGTLSQSEVVTTPNGFPVNTRAPDGTLRHSEGLTYPIPTLNATATVGSIQQTRIVTSGSGSAITFTLFFGNTTLRSESGDRLSVKGFYNRHNDTSFIIYNTIDGATAKFGWLTTNAASTALLDQQHFTASATLVGSSYQFDGRLYSQFGSNSFGDIFMTADHISIPSSRGLLWMQEGKRTFVELPLPYGAFAVMPIFRLNSCNVHNHATERKVSTWYSNNQPDTTNTGYSVVLAEYTIQ
jgi:hypothetical protein